MSETVPDLPWHVIHGSTVLDMLNRVAAGDTPQAVYAEEYANCEQPAPPAEALTEDELLSLASAARMLERSTRAAGWKGKAQEWSDLADKLGALANELAE